MLVPALFLVLLAPAAPQLQVIDSLGSLQTTDYLDFVFRDTIPGVVEKVGNMAAPLSESCKEAVATYSKPANRTVLFYIYTKSNPEGTEVKAHDMEGLKKSGFNASWPTKILCPGFAERFTLFFSNDHQRPNSELVFVVYLQLEENYNVVVMDYTRTTGYWSYLLATIFGLLECRDQGTEFIRWLYEIGYLDPSKCHMIGLSLGAQVAAIIAANVQVVLQIVIGRLTGLDPAGPAFSPNWCAQHVISKGDARYVDVYHTSSQTTTLGIDHSCGDADFYINGGMKQPCCLDPTCDHISVGYIWDESIRNPSVLGACRNNPRTLNAFRTCSDEEILFGERNYGTVFGELYVPYPCKNISLAVATTFETCWKNIF